MAGSGGAQNSILSNDQFLNAICSSDASNQLDDLCVVETSVSTDYEECVLSALRDGLEDASDKGFGVVRLLEDGDLLAKAGPGETTWLVELFVPS